MPLLLHEIKERLKELDEVTLLELLDISSEDLVDVFGDKIEENAVDNSRDTLAKLLNILFVDYAKGIIMPDLKIKVNDIDLWVVGQFDFKFKRKNICNVKNIECDY